MMDDYSSFEIFFFIYFVQYLQGRCFTTADGSGELQSDALLCGIICVLCIFETHSTRKRAVSQQTVDLGLCTTLSEQFSQTTDKLTRDTLFTAHHSLFCFEYDAMDSQGLFSIGFIFQTLVLHNSYKF